MTPGAITARALALVAIGGAAGAPLRYLLMRLFADHLTPGALFPWAIMLENVLGSFGLGFLVWLAADRFGLGVEARLLLGTGLLGGFTTYSNYAVDIVRLADGGHWLLALTYATLTTVLSLGAALAGLGLARLASRPAIGA
jgi:fluoride exporter